MLHTIIYKRHEHPVHMHMHAHRILYDTKLKINVTS